MSHRILAGAATLALALPLAPLAVASAAPARVTTPATAATPAAPQAPGKAKGLKIRATRTPELTQARVKVTGKD